MTFNKKHFDQNPNPSATAIKKKATLQMALMIFLLLF